ncbi:MAG: DUF3060 domain-containing protein [Candidatus Eremiobacteraeota bacterium]|nr:DUF3060 domain-containing protein [Candidatus Eremiobacteraeota bacterium]MCW5870664.1 DUF3060 domain-containing protein [Candidatus Eremiobacteraeota bacterium]
MRKLLAVILLLALPASCETHNLVLTGQNRVLNVRAGDTIDLVGDSNQVTIQGDCVSLNLTGSGNTVRLEGQMTSVQILGSDNQINWVQAGHRRAPLLQSMGRNNRVVAVGP